MDRHSTLKVAVMSSSILDFEEGENNWPRSLMNVQNVRVVCN